MAAGVTIGVDVGGTKVLAVALDADGVERGRHRAPTPRAAPDGSDGGRLLLGGVVAAVDDLVASLDLDPATPVGVGVAGLVDHDGVLRHGPNQPGVGTLDVPGGLAARLAGPVTVDNDANCALRAEIGLGAARGETEVVLVTLGTGIGGAILTSGHLVRGVHGLAGEPGHTMVDPRGPVCVCGRRGCWERYASGAGLARLAQEAADDGRLSALLASVPDGRIRGEDVVAAARRGDEGAGAVIDRFAWWTAVGLANLSAVLDPALIILGGGLVDAADVWLDRVRAELPALLVAAESRPVPRIEAATYGSSATAVGAALLARGR